MSMKKSPTRIADKRVLVPTNNLYWLDDVTEIRVKHPVFFSFNYVLECVTGEKVERYKLDRYRTGLWNSYRVRKKRACLAKFELSSNEGLPAASFNCTRMLDCPEGDRVAIAKTRPTPDPKAALGGDVYTAYLYDENGTPQPRISHRVDTVTTVMNIRSPTNEVLGTLKVEPLCSCIKSSVVHVTFTEHATAQDKLLMIDLSLVCAETTISSPCTWVVLIILATLSLVITGATVAIMVSMHGGKQQ